MKLNIIVPEGAATERLDVFLATRTPLARAKLQQLIRTCSVLVNQQAAKPSYLCRPGDAVEIDIPDPTPPHTAPAPKLTVRYEDDDVVVIDKPAGLLTHPVATAPASPSIVDYARTVSSDPDPDRPGIVHRLDKDTSGLLLLAKTAEAKQLLQAQFADRAITKTYIALVVGRPVPEAAEIRLPMSRSHANPLRRAVAAHGKMAITAYHTQTIYSGYTLVEASPKTGRTHQLRVHFATIGHPIAGDTLYGPPKRPLGLKRQFLHAASLTFTSPGRGSVTVKSPLPDDLASVLHNLSGNR